MLYVPLLCLTLGRLSFTELWLLEALSHGLVIAETCQWLQENGLLNCLALKRSSADPKAGSNSSFTNPLEAQQTRSTNGDVVTDGRHALMVSLVNRSITTHLVCPTI